MSNEVEAVDGDDGVNGVDAGAPADVQGDRRRRPVRGALSGLALGLGVLLLLVVYAAATFTTVVPFIVILVGFVVFGVLFGLFAPARRRRS